MNLSSLHMGWKCVFVNHEFILIRNSDYLSLGNRVSIYNHASIELK